MTETVSSAAPAGAHKSSARVPLPPVAALRGCLAPILLGIALLGLWEVYVRSMDLDALFLPAPSDITAYLLANPMIFVNNVGVTFNALVLGFLAGIVIGFSLGVLMHLSSWLREAAYPWLVVSQMVPIPAIAPVFVLWFGFTLAPKLIVVALICFFPVAVSTIDGLRATPSEMVRMLQTFGAGPWRIMLMAKIPGALPRVFSGLRVAMALSVVATVFGEWVGSSRGLGNLMLHFSNRLETPALFATVAVLSALGVILFALVGIAERIALPWARQLEQRTR